MNRWEIVWWLQISLLKRLVVNRFATNLKKPFLSSRVNVMRNQLIRHFIVIGYHI